MDPEKLLEAINALVDGLRADMTKYCDKMDSDNKARDAKYDEIATSMGQQYDMIRGSLAKRKDGYSDVPGNTMAEKTAADRRSDSVDPAAFAALASSVNEMKKRQSRPMGDLNAFADTQAKADAVLRTHNERAEPPMSGEDIIAYNIRAHRPLQKHSPKWKGVELSIIAADHKALENVLSEIRADALKAGLNPVGLELFQHREFVQESAGGHKISSFVGNGTIFKQLSRPIRHVGHIGTRVNH
jgi:hypothetical protein